ncbi:cytochrome c oxidase assembly protein [Xylophilus sp.]|uniref:cytochrome c oxidase assembly protein n=1 Tax=Xylophilus sp. TaxID=2653893 RepID=UPI0013BBF0F9|nr:cytochrome c oxidase assembly protein [Xylophilus sp.]KAF1047439.1 MAG: Gluconate 2-dehydrogenase cytochrome c subunit [Xylophilus sp.]
MLLLAAAALAYGAGLLRLLRRSGRGRRLLRALAGAFAGGWLALAGAFASPLDGLSEWLFAAHMLQHEALMIVAAPLLVLGRPLAVGLWALPRRLRTALGRLPRAPAAARCWAAASGPLGAWVLHGLALWVWHVPRFFEAALRHPGLHWVQHASFLGSAVLFWWSVLGRGGPQGGAALLSLFTTMVHTAALGALLTLAPALWYPIYLEPAAALGMDPLRDQQVGGLIMWVPAGLAYVLAGLALAWRWLALAGAGAAAAGGAAMTAWRRLLAAGLLAAAALAARGAEPAALVARGAYLARIGGCAACHTDPKGGAPFAGGRPMPSPFGPIHSSNITPDPAHGLGRYTFADFARAMREGRARGDRPLYPAMPYASYAKMDDADLRALFAYLREGVAPQAVPTPPNHLPFPFDQRWALRIWQALFLPRGVYAPRPGRDAAWNRGAYLVQSVGHCGSCHTPRGPGYQEKGYDEGSDQFLTGTVTDRWFATNLTGDPGGGLGRVDARALAELLRTGRGGGSVVWGSMAEEVEETLRHLSEDDARAIARYLKSLPPQRVAGRYDPARAGGRGPADGRYDAATNTAGRAAYHGFCMACHGEDGRGQPPQVPALAGNPSLLGREPQSLVRIVVEGGRGPAVDGAPAPLAMPGFGGTLTDLQIAQALSYVRQSWGNDGAPVTASDVSQVRQRIGR